MQNICWFQLLLKCDDSLLFSVLDDFWMMRVSFGLFDKINNVRALGFSYKQMGIIEKIKFRWIEWKQPLIAAFILGGNIYLEWIYWLCLWKYCVVFVPPLIHSVWSTTKIWDILWILSKDRVFKFLSSTKIKKTHLPLQHPEGDAWQQYLPFCYTVNGMQSKTSTTVWQKLPLQLCYFTYESSTACSELPSSQLIQDTTKR